MGWGQVRTEMAKEISRSWVLHRRKHIQLFKKLLRVFFLIGLQVGQMQDNAPS